MHSTEIQARNLAKLSTVGVRIVRGTDGNTPWAPHVEMADLIAAGVALQARASFIDCAQRSKGDRERGRLERGFCELPPRLDGQPLFVFGTAFPDRKNELRARREQTISS